MISSAATDTLSASLFKLTEHDDILIIQVKWKADFCFESEGVKSGSGSAYNYIYFVNVDKCSFEVTGGGLITTTVMWQGSRVQDTITFDPPDTIGGFFTMSYGSWGKQR